MSRSPSVSGGNSRERKRQSIINSKSHFLATGDATQSRTFQLIRSVGLRDESQRDRLYWLAIDNRILSANDSIKMLGFLHQPNLRSSISTEALLVERFVMLYISLPILGNKR
jgi:hypothetical protein